MLRLTRHLIRIRSQRLPLSSFQRYFKSDNDDDPSGFGKLRRKGKKDAKANPESTSKPAPSEKKEEKFPSKEEDGLNENTPEDSNKDPYNFSDFRKNLKDQFNELNKRSSSKKSEDPRDPKDPNSDSNKEKVKDKKTLSEILEEYEQLGQKYIHKDFKFNSYPTKAFLFSIAALALTYKLYSSTREDPSLITFTELLNNYVARDEVTKLKIVRMKDGSNYRSEVEVHTLNGGVHRVNIGNPDNFLENLESFQIERGRSLNSLIPVEYEYKVDGSKRLEDFLNGFYLVISVAIIFAIFRSFRSQSSSMKNAGGGRGDIFNIGKSTAKVFGINTKVDVGFKDVAGLDEAKLEISEFVDFLKSPEKYKELGAKIPRGALLSGPPGTGKTMLAKACAGEANVPFFFISGSDFVEMFVGVGASRVRDLFKQARSKAPSIIFIDEIDAVGKKRDGKFGGNDERDATLNQLLVEMDGFGTDTSVVVLAATNRKELLDPALTRPGRFDRNIDINLPDLDGRFQIFLVHLKPIVLDPSKSIESFARRLATLTPGFSGADIANLCNEAAILAARRDKLHVETSDFEEASERVVAGLQRKSLMSEEERRTVAVHESGHAVVSWFLEGGNPLLKVTIIPRSKGALGFAQYLPSEAALSTKEELLDQICGILGGRCAEEEFFSKVTTGAYDDLRKVYQMASALVTKYGMSEVIGYLGFEDETYVRPYSEETQELIDSEIHEIVRLCSERTRRIIKERKSYIESMSKVLLEKDTLDLQLIVGILGERPFPPRANFKAYLETRKADEEEEKSNNEPPSNDNVNPANLNPAL